jgi:outer membrane protein OmpA-like peptidoglycan-associated protein
MNPRRKLFYVYVMETGNRQDAFEAARKIRKETPYFDTWVFTGTLGETDDRGADLNPETGKGMAIVAISDSRDQETSKEQNQIATDPALLTTPAADEPDGSKKFIFKIFSSAKEIGGDVDVMDLDKTKPRKAATYRGNEAVAIKAVNNSGNMGLVCEVFGYRKLQQTVNFNVPQSTEGVTVDDNKVIVPFDLVRLKKGDIAIMYNVYFYKDAAVMRPESHYEATSLYEMLLENPKYKIRIHGHTNGNSGGKIISMGDSKNFFSLKDTKEGSGSAKKLSEERAKVIESYLVSKGIDPSRMEIKAWGGKKPVYEEDSQNAHANVRVEIEILEE